MKNMTTENKPIIEEAANPVEICYRCGQDAWQNLAGYPYCVICFFVVEAMMDTVRHDPPPGFPGARSGAIGWHQKMMDRLGKDFEKKLERKT